MGGRKLLTDLCVTILVTMTIPALAQARPVRLHSFFWHGGHGGGVGGHYGGVHHGFGGGWGGFFGYGVGGYYYPYYSPFLFIGPGGFMPPYSAMVPPMMARQGPL